MYMYIKHVGLYVLMYYVTIKQFICYVLIKHYYIKIMISVLLCVYVINMEYKYKLLYNLYFHLNIRA